LLDEITTHYSIVIISLNLVLPEATKIEKEKRLEQQRLKPSSAATSESHCTEGDRGARAAAQKQLFIV